MNRGAAIYGAGGHAHVVASIIRANRIELLGFFDDEAQKTGDTILGAPVLGTFRDIIKHRDQITAVYLGLGDNLARSQAFKNLRRESFELPALIHPRALVEQNVSIADGSVICMGAHIATEASVGRACLLNTGCCLEHESQLGDLVHLGPNSTIAGRTSIGELTFEGIGAVIAQGLSIGRLVAIGANSVVLKDVADGSKVLGIHH